jgi:hypothetical protein
MPVITPLQLRMARAGLDLSAREVSAITGLTIDTVCRVERGCGALASTLTRLTAAYEHEGAVFTIGGVEFLNGGRRRPRAVARDDREREVEVAAV